ncbi:uncharacterized protein TNCV_4306691 [Trichonephila clavipes]|nr:uncharacterized protein TNCV_4306691 [Trichonephila clavipes]
MCSIRNKSGDQAGQGRLATVRRQLCDTLVRSSIVLLKMDPGSLCRSGNMWLQDVMDKPLGCHGKGRIEEFTTGSPYTNTIVITAEIKSGFALASLKKTWFHSAAVHFPHAWHHSKLRRRWLAVKGSKRNGRHDPKCPSGRHLRMDREDTGAPNEGATCAWMAADEAVGSTRAFLTMWWSS